MNTLYAIFPPLSLGLLAAMAVNYLSDVLPRSRRFARPRCQHCDQILPWGIYLRNQPCPACQAHPWRRRHLVAGLVVFVLYLWFWVQPSADLMPSHQAIGWARAISWVLLVVFGTIFVIDVEYRVVLDQVSLIGGLLFAGLGSWLHGWQTTAIGGLGGFLFMYALYGLGVLYLRWKNRSSLSADDVALGFGDVKLATILGLLLGWPDVLIMLLLALLLGGVFGLFILIILILQKRDTAAAAMPYAPYLLAVTAYILLW